MFARELEAIKPFERYYDAGGVRTRCFEAGNWMPLILLHGGGGHAEAWVRNIFPLSKHFRVLAVDYLGHGYTDKPKIAYDLEAFSKHLLDFMDAAGIPKAHLVGESQGASISLFTAHERPERVERLVLSVGGLPANEHGYTAGMDRLAELTREAVQETTMETVRKRMEWLFYDPKTLPDELVEIRLKIYRQPEFQERAAQGRARKNYRLLEKMPKLACPILFFWTTHNPSCPWEIAERVHRSVPGSRFVLVDHSAHWPQFERPDEFNRIVTEFLSADSPELLIDTYRRRFW